MRIFKDPRGVEWEAIVGRESWGTVVAIFVPRKGDESPRQALLDVSSWDEGNRLLLEMNQGELQDLLMGSKEKPMG